MPGMSGVPVLGTDGLPGVGVNPSPIRSDVWAVPPSRLAESMALSERPSHLSSLSTTRNCFMVANNGFEAYWLSVILSKLTELLHIQAA